MKASFGRKSNFPQSEIRNLKSAIEMVFFDDYRNLIRFSDEKMVKINLFESHRMFADLYCMMPGQEQKVHTHEGEDKIYFVLEGGVTAIVGDEERTIRSGAGCSAPAGVPHGVRNDSGENVVLLVFMAPHPRLKATA